MASPKTSYLVHGVPGCIDYDTAKTKIELYFQNRLIKSEVEVESVKPHVVSDDRTKPWVFVVEFDGSKEAVQSNLPSDGIDYNISIKGKEVRLMLETFPKDADIVPTNSTLAEQSHRTKSELNQVQETSSYSTLDARRDDLIAVLTESFTIDTMSTTSEYSLLSHSKIQDKKNGQSPLSRSSFQGDEYAVPPTSEILHEIDGEGPNTSDDRAMSHQTTIEITGFKEQTSMEHLKLYFANRDVSGGGKILETKMMNGRLHLTFQHLRHADRVLDGRVHKVDDAILSVRKVGTTPIDNTSFLLSGLPRRANEAEYELLLYLENCTGKQDPTLIYAEGYRKAMVTYPTEIRDFEKLKQTIEHKPFQNASLSCEIVRQSNCVMVRNLAAGTTETLLSLYFENKRSGGGEVERVELNKENASAFVYFKNYMDAMNVLSKTHTLKNTVVRVEPFYDFLGRGISDSHASDFEVETSTVVDVNPSIIEYIMETGHLKTEVVEKLRDVNTEIMWPFNQKETAKLKRIESNVSSCTVESWQKAAVSVLNGYCNEFSCEEVQALEIAFDELLKQTAATADICGVKVTSRPATFQIGLCGKTSKVNEIKEEVELQLEKERSKRSEDIPVTPLQVRQLTTLEFPSLAQKEYTNVKVIIDHEKTNVRIDGEVANIDLVKTMLYKFLADLKGKVLSSSPLAKFLSSEKAQSHLTRVVNDSGILAVYDSQRGDITISAVNQNSVDTAVRVLYASVKQKDMNVPNESRSCLHGAGWQYHVDDVEKKFSVVVEGYANQPDRVTVTGFVDDVEKAMACIQLFINCNTTNERFIAVASGKVEFMFKHMQPALDDLAETGMALKEKKDENSGATGVIIHGKKQNIDKGEKRIREYLDAICHDRRQMNEPGLSRLFQQEGGQAYIRFVQEQNRCIIDVSICKVGRTGLTEEIEAPQRLHSSLTTVCHVQLNAGPRVLVMKGDITQMRVDAIVNSANNRLDHGHGVAKAIIDAGGKVIQEDSNNIIKNRGKLLDAQVVSTEPGRLHCKILIHAVGPTWDVGNDADSEKHSTDKKLLLADAVTQSLDKARKRSCKSVAIPAISSGIFGFPVDVCTDVIVEAVETYIQHNRVELLDVYLVDPRDEVCSKFKEALERHCRHSIEYPQGYQQNLVGHVNNAGDNCSQLNCEKARSDRCEIATSEGKVIRLVIGNITEQVTDVIVNTTGKDMSLRNGGGVSQAILRDGGAVIQKELDEVKRRRGNPDAGQLFVTKGGALKCKAMYHAFCGPWTTGKNDPGKVVSDIMRKAFEKACTSGMNSITFPAIGTGGCGYPRERVADIMIEEGLNLSRTYPNSSVIDIQIIVYDKDRSSIQAFQEKFARCNLLPTDHPQSSHFSRHAEGLNLLNPESYSDVTMSIGNVHVKLVQGDISKQSGDVIVNCVDTKLKCDRGVSQAIIKAAGPEVKSELETLEKPRVGGNVLTGAGRLNCKQIIHLVPDPDNIKDSVHGVLKLADMHKFRTIVMPAIGTGYLNKDPKEIAKKIFGGIKASHKLETVNSVRIVIYQPEMMGVFKKAMEDYCDPSKKKKIKRKLRKVTNRKGRHMDPQLHRKDTDASGGGVESFPAVWFDIYAGTQNDIISAFDKLRNYIEKQVIEKVVDDPDIGGLSNEDIRQIYELASSLQACAEIVNTGRVCRLKLTGIPEAVMTINDKVNQFLKRVQEEHKRVVEATALAKNVAWLYWNEDGFEPYEDEVAGHIEQEYKAGNADASFELDDGSYKVSFSSMTEIDLTNGSKVSVRRDLKEGGISLPKHWAPMHDSEEVKQVPLIRSSEEYISIADEFKKWMVQSVKEIVEIKRIQNRQLYRQVMLMKQTIQQRSKPWIQIERNLYHGTSFESCAKINAGGFNRNFAGKHAAAYGRGCYFALNAKYSSEDRFSPRDTNGHKHIYVCKVLTGEYTQGKREFLVPPSKNPNNPTDYYDSVVDNTANPTIFVIFYDAMAYPEYLITFK